MLVSFHVRITTQTKEIEINTSKKNVTQQIITEVN